LFVFDPSRVHKAKKHVGQL